MFYRASKTSKLFNGLHCGAPGKSLIQLNGISRLSIKGDSIIRSALLSGEGDVLSHTSGVNGVGKHSLISGLSTGVEIQPDAVSFGKLVADIIHTPSGFPAEIDEFDLDHPTKAFSSIPEAIEDIRQGKVGFLKCSFCNTLLSVAYCVPCADGIGCG